MKTYLKVNSGNTIVVDDKSVTCHKKSPNFKAILQHYPKMQDETLNQIVDQIKRETREEDGVQNIHEFDMLLNYYETDSEEFKQWVHTQEEIKK